MKASHLNALLHTITSTIDQFIVGELNLPELDMKVATSCPDSSCDGQLNLLSHDILLQMRKKTTDGHAKEKNSLKCSKCSITCSVTSRIEAALENGYQRCFGRHRLTDDEVRQLIWKRLPEKPVNGDVMELDRWLLNLSSIHMLVNMHDWKHRNSCFKSGGNSCRYKIPQVPISKTNAKPVYSNVENATNEEENLNWLSPKSIQKEDIIQLVIDVKKRPVFMFLTDCNQVVLSAFNCNNCVRYVQDQKVSLYYGAYASKHNNENEKALTELMRSLTIYEKRQNARQNVSTEKVAEDKNEVINENSQKCTSRSDASFGLGRLLSGARASTNGETVGAPLAAFAARGNKIFEMSHETAVLPLNQAKAYLEDKPLRASISKQGIVLATVYDYVFRTKSDVFLSNMNFWTFTATQETGKINKSTQSNDEVIYNYYTTLILFAYHLYFYQEFK